MHALMQVVGPHVRLSAVAWLERPTIFPLTPLLNLLPAHPVTDRLVMPVSSCGLGWLASAQHETQGSFPYSSPIPDEAGLSDLLSDSPLAYATPPCPAASSAHLCCQVARMLAALRTGLRELEAAAHMPEAALQQRVAGKKWLPWPIGMDAHYDTARVQQLTPHNPIYYVPLASSSGASNSPKAVVIKLCRKYGLAAHRAWADLGLAPEVGIWQFCDRSIAEGVVRAPLGCVASVPCCIAPVFFMSSHPESSGSDTPRVPRLPVCPPHTGSALRVTAWRLAAG